MKNLLLLLLISVTSIAVNANDTLNTKQISETERIIDKYGDKIVNSFNSFAEKTLPIAEDGFKIIVKLQIAKGLINLIPLIAFIIFIILVHKEYNRLLHLLNQEEVPSYMDRDYGPFGEDNISFPLLLYLIITIVLGLLSLFTTNSGFLYLIAPEWFAIKEIINLF